MKARNLIRFGAGLSLLLACLAFLATACKTTPPVDWNSRVGTYTFDQAVKELGLPDKYAHLTDGTFVAEWVRHSNTGLSFGFGTGVIGSHSAVGVGQTVTTSPGDKLLRLVFGPDNKLLSWTKNY